MAVRDPERTIEFEFVRATDNATLHAMHWIGRGQKEAAVAAACDAIYGVFDLVNMRREVVVAEGIKENAPGIFLGDWLGTWKEGSPRFDIALDPVDGTTTRHWHHRQRAAARGKVDREDRNHAFDPDARAQPNRAVHNLEQKTSICAAIAPIIRLVVPHHD